MERKRREKRVFEDSKIQERVSVFCKLHLVKMQLRMTVYELIVLPPTPQTPGKITFKREREKK